MDTEEIARRLGGVEAAVLQLSKMSENMRYDATCNERHDGLLRSLEERFGHFFSEQQVIKTEIEKLKESRVRLMVGLALLAGTASSAGTLVIRLLGG